MTILQRYIFVPQLVIGPPLFQELGMRAALCDLPPVDDEYLVRVDDGGEPVGVRLVQMFQVN